MYATYTNLVLVPAEFFKDSKRTWLPQTTVLSITTRHQRRGTRKNAGIERSKKKKKEEQTGNYKWDGPARKEQKEKKKARKQCNVLEDKKKKKQKKFVSRLQHSYNFYLSLSFNFGSLKKGFKLIIIVKD